MPDWGSKNIDAFVPTQHHEVYDAINPVRVTLQAPFVACIVGASRGIGSGIAASYAAAGATGLVLASRRISGLEDTAARCRELRPGINIEVVPCDITSEEDVISLAAVVKERFGGRLDAVVVNSGYSGPVKLKITETAEDTFRNAIAVNYVGTFLCAKYLIPLLLATENGAKAFIGVSSIAAFIVRGPIANAQYCVSKAAQLKLLEMIHEQYSPDAEGGLGVFAVHPGAVLSEMARETAPEEFMSYLIDSPDLCGAFCVWLTKDKSKRWLGGRLSSALWDVEELEGKKDEVVARDLLKMGLVE